MSKVDDTNVNCTRQTLIYTFLKNHSIEKFLISRDTMNRPKSINELASNQKYMFYYENFNKFILNKL